MQFAEELHHILPPDLPHREVVVAKAAEHLKLIAAANEFMNLTRITDAREAAIKHVYDSIAPWRLFQGAKRVLDAGTGAGFPGIPLALVLPGVQFVLTESTQKKARFVDSVVEALDLPNVDVHSSRAEDVLSGSRPEIVTARAVAPLPRLLDLFGKAVKQGSRLLLYKGPDVEAELRDAAKYPVVAEVIDRYELPEGCGSRVILQVSRKK